MVFQIDTGAQISLIQKKTLSKESFIDSSQIYALFGVENTETNTKTIGFTFIPLKIGDKLINTKFHVINDDSFCIGGDGILGGKFFYSIKAIIDYGDQQIILE